MAHSMMEILSLSFFTLVQTFHEMRYNKIMKTPKKARRLVKCPRCKCPSQVVFTEFGMQYRTCKRGHEFTYDKRQADRPLFGL